MLSVELNNIIPQIKINLPIEYAVIIPCRSENSRVPKKRESKKI